MAEQSEKQIVYLNPQINTEKGLNAERFKKFLTEDPESVEFKGKAGPVAQILHRLKRLPGVKYEDSPGKGDNIADKIESENPTLFDEDNNNSTWYNYMRKKKDFVFGLFADYLGGPALRTANGFYAGYFVDNEKDAEDFIKRVENKYPISPEFEVNLLAEEINRQFPVRHDQTQTPGEPAPTSPSPTSPGVGASTYYEVIRRIPVNGTAPELYEETEEGVRIKFQKSNKGG